jgi:hypothetical protein
MKTVFLFASLVLFTAATGATGCFFEEKPANTAPGTTPAPPTATPAGTAVSAPASPGAAPTAAAAPGTTTPDPQAAPVNHPPRMRDPPNQH